LRKAPGRDGVLEADGKGSETAVPDPLGKPGRLEEFSGGLLDGDFPYGRGTDVYIWLVIEPGLDVI
jgi:hypothetical protein